MAVSRGRLCLAVVGVAGLLGAAGCSSDTTLTTMTQPGWNQYSNPEPTARVTAAASTDLVGPDGRCASDSPAVSPVLNFQAGPEANPGAPARGLPPAPNPMPMTRGIALQMTECEVVRVAGPTNMVEISANERGQRVAVLTYMGGARPGIYRFVGGRLAAIERGPEPPPPAPKAAKSKKAAKQQ
jgi:hypothetical protein